MGYSTAEKSKIKPINKKTERIKVVVYITLSSLCYSIGFHYFISSARFAPGGIAGILAMVKYLIGAQRYSTKLDFSVFLILLLNIPLVIIARKQVSTKFAVRTLITSTLVSLELFFLDNFIDPLYAFSIGGVPTIDDMGQRILSAVFGGILTGMSLAVSLKVGSSTGGTDIIGLVLQKKNPHKSVASMIMAVNSVIVIASIFVYNDSLIPVLLAFLFIYISSVTCDHIVQGSKSVIKFEVITEHCEDISEEIIKRLGRGVTVTPATGMFEHKSKSLLICLIRPRQIAKFQQIIKKYPDTFAFFAPVGAVVGRFDETPND